LYTTDKTHLVPTHSVNGWTNGELGYLWLTKGSKGKTLVTFDSDVKPHHNNSREREAEYSYVQYIRQNKPGRSRERVWQNVPIPDGSPDEGLCFAFTRRWLLEL
jgi:hypothetical protein